MGADPFIPVASPVLGERELELVTDAVRSGWISYQGRYVGEFEQAFARSCGAAFGVAVSSGTTALHVALAAAGVGPGDEVIVPALCHIAAPNMVSLTGAAPVLADVDPETWCLDPRRVEAKLTARTKAVLPVHLYGHPADMDPILELARARGLVVIEDAAEAHGAMYKGRPVGSLGHMTCYSFYANKMVTTGEGGMVLTSDPALAERCRRLRDEALEDGKLFWYRELGFSYRMTNLQAAVGLAQTARLEEFVEARRANARRYNERLAGLPGLALPPERPWARNVYWMYSVLVEGSFGPGRDELRAGLREAGVDSRPFFPAVHEQPLYKARFEGQRYPAAEGLSRRGLNLPSGSGLREDELERVVAALRALGRQPSASHG